MDAARINFSHGTHAEHRKEAEAVRDAADAARKPVAIVEDIQGPKVRIGSLPEPRRLDAGSTATLGGGKGSVPVTYEGLARDVRPGARILIDDGLIELRVLEVSGGAVRCEVVHGGMLTSHKGVNLPGCKLSLDSVTAKDRADVQAGVKLDVDYIAASFVRSPGDVQRVRELLMRDELPIQVLAKIETAEALDDLDAVLKASDGAIVARGDLGVELPPEEVPVAQKEIISAANRLGVPVVTATQMLESMIEKPRPTRAEASDVANAIFDGTGAVMLSGETAVGAHPVEAVRVMAKIIESAERAYFERFRQGVPAVRHTVADAIAHATVTTAHDLDAKAILCFTNSGGTAKLVSKYRPKTVIMGATPLDRTLRQLSLVWGIVPVKVPRARNEEELLATATAIAKEHGVVGKADLLVITSGQLGVTATTSHLRVRIVE